MGAAGHTEGFLGGKLRLFQLARGHRAGTDAALLAACVPATAAGPGVDVGAGVGPVGLAALRRAPALTMTMAEVDPAAAALLRANIKVNALEARATVAECDVLQPAARRAADLHDNAAALVLTNPPFYEAGAVRASPDAGRARAHVAGESGAQGWMRASLALLGKDGLFVAIHRPQALHDLLEGAAGRIGALAIMPVHARAEEAAIRILLAGRKGSRAPLRLLPPLVLHDAQGAFTARAQALHNGEAGLELA
ncbi:MAG: methyltransferase [Hyphomicrobiales bacterium]|nr:methyltransferase [Hyphomicrobiales bacterium]